MKIGQIINKKSGYKFKGEIVSVFKNLKGETRIVAEHLDSNTTESSGMLHIFNPSQVEVEVDAEPNVRLEAILVVRDHETPEKAFDWVNELLNRASLSFEGRLKWIAIREEIQKNLK